MKRKKECIECGKEFLGSGKAQLCSDRCRRDRANRLQNPNYNSRGKLKNQTFEQGEKVFVNYYPHGSKNPVRTKVTVIKCYKNFILCKLNKYKECFKSYEVSKIN